MQAHTPPTANNNTADADAPSLPATLHWAAYLFGHERAATQTPLARFLTMLFYAISTAICAYAVYSTWQYMHLETYWASTTHYSDSVVLTVIKDFLSAQTLDFIIAVGLFVLLSTALAKTIPSDAESFWRTRPVSPRQIAVSYGALAAASAVLWCILLPIAFSLAAELSWTICLRWCAIRLLLFLFAQTFLLATLADPSSKRFKQSILPMGAICFVCANMMFRFCSIEAPDFIAALGVVWLAAAFIAVRIFIFQKRTKIPLIWLLTVASAIGIGFGVEYLKKQLELPLPESDLAMTVEKENNVVLSDSHQTLRIILPNTGSTDGALWRITGCRMDSEKWESFRGTYSVEKLEALCRKELGLPASQKTKTKNVAVESILRLTNIRKLEVRLEEVRLVKLLDIPENKVHYFGKDETIFMHSLSVGENEPYRSIFTRQIGVSNLREIVSFTWGQHNTGINELGITNYISSDFWWFGLTTSKRREVGFQKISCRTEANPVFQQSEIRTAAFVFEPTGRKAVKTFTLDPNGKWQPAATTLSTQSASSTVSTTTRSPNN
jgi:hypothetical protein